MFISTCVLSVSIVKFYFVAKVTIKFCHYFGVICTLTHPYTHTHTHTHTQRRSFIDNHHDFGMDKATFKEFVTEALPTAADSATLLWERFDTNRTKMVNALEVSTALFGTR